MRSDGYYVWLHVLVAWPRKMAAIDGGFVRKRLPLPLDVYGDVYVRGLLETIDKKPKVPLELEFLFEQLRLAALIFLKATEEEKDRDLLHVFL